MNKLKEHDKLRCIVFAGLFAALTAILTFTLHIPVGNGYIHCGDAVIFAAAAFLPAPYAIASSAIGGMLADLLAGYASYALPTFIIKGLLALTFSAVGGKKPLCARRVVGLVLCAVVSIVGYWITGVILYGGWAAQFIATVPGNCIQAIGSSLVYAVFALAWQQVSKVRTHGAV